MKTRTTLKGLGKRIGKAEGPRRPRRTTSENRQELDRVLADIETRPPLPPDQLGPDKRPTVAESQREIDRVLAVLGGRHREALTNSESDAPTAQQTTTTTESSQSVQAATSSTTMQGGSNG